MPRVKAEIDLLALDKAKYYKYFQRNMLNVLKNAATQFALAAERFIPVWSGMAKGALLAESRIERMDGGSYNRKAEVFLGLTDSSSSIDISSQLKVGPGSGFMYKGKHKLSYLYYLSGERKDKDAGAARSGYYFYISTKKSYFYFETRIHHFSMAVVQKIWPEASLIAGRWAADATISALANSIVPDENDYIIKTSAKIYKGRKLLPERFTGSMPSVRRELAAIASRKLDKQLNDLIKRASIPINVNITF